MKNKSYSVLVNTVPYGGDRLEKAIQEFSSAFRIRKQESRRILKRVPVLLLEDLDTDEVQQLKDTLVDLSEKGVEFRITSEDVISENIVIWSGRPDVEAVEPSGSNEESLLSCPICRNSLSVESLGSSVSLSGTPATAGAFRSSDSDADEKTREDNTEKRVETAVLEKEEERETEKEKDESEKDTELVGSTENGAKSGPDTGTELPGATEKDLAGDTAKLEYLKEFTRIVESDRPSQDKIKMVQELEEKNEQFREVSEKHFPDLVLQYFSRDLRELPGVGKKSERSLLESGFCTVEDVAKASPEELTEVPGIGKKRAGKLKEEARKLKGEVVQEV